MLYREYSSDKMKQNIEKYIRLEEGEEVLVILDLTIFGEGQRGMVYTNKRFVKYNKNNPKKRFEYRIDLIKNLEAREVDPERYEYRLILTDTGGREYDLTDTGVPNDELKVFAYIIHKIQSGTE